MIFAQFVVKSGSRCNFSPPASSYRLEEVNGAMGPYTEEVREDALIRLMEGYGDSVKRMCCVYLRDLGVAEDAAQDTFLKAYEHIDQILSGEIRNEKAWLMRIAINTCRDTLRSSWMRHIDRRRAIEELPLAAPPQHQENLELTEAILSLPPKLKDIVLLHYYQGLTLRICAQILGISAPTASRYLAQAMKRLRLDLERG